MIIIQFNEFMTKHESSQIIIRRFKIEQRKIKRKIYRKRKNILIKKIYEYEKLCKIDITIIICQNNRYFICRSMNRFL